jgi:hypothetical protein
MEKTMKKSAFIGSVRGPHANSPHDVAEVWADRDAVTLNLFDGDVVVEAYQRFDPIAARNLAALLVRASEEVEQMRARSEPE